MSKSHQMVTKLLESDSDWQFSDSYTAEVYDYYEGDDYKEAKCELAVTWEADFDVRSWGIKEIVPVIRNITGSVDILDPETGDPVERIPVSFPAASTPEHLEQVLGSEPTPESSPKDWALYYGASKDPWTVEIEHSPGEDSHAMRITAINVHVKTRKITVEF